MASQNFSLAKNINISFLKSVIYLMSVGVNNYKTVRQVLLWSLGFSTRSWKRTRHVIYVE